MSLTLAVLAGLAAVLIPVYLIGRYRPMLWPMHVLAVAAALAIGLAPGTALLNSAYGSHLYGFAFVFLMVWGLGGLVLYRRRGLKRA
jgi:hypothetical protein